MAVSQTWVGVWGLEFGVWGLALLLEALQREGGYGPYWAATEPGKAQDTFQHSRIAHS